jgi:urate oxidase
MVEAFVETHSLSLQQTLYAMGEAAVRARPEVVEARLSLPNKHHFLVDLTPFGLDNPDEVYLAADRPYGLIEATVHREGVADAPLAWSLRP